MEDREDEFAAVAARIEANPLGRLMYGQRELFHSNLIGWFFDQLPETADAVFRPLAHDGEDAGRWVDRERRHMDMVFHWPDRAPLVVENKVFAIPDARQLEEYRSVTASWSQRPALVLLSVSAPDFDLGEWRHLPYAGLAERIEAALPAGSAYEVETMRRYAALVRDLHALVALVEVVSDSETVWLPEPLLSSITSSQMRAALQKARAQRVARTLDRDLVGAEQAADSGMTNGTPLVEHFQYLPLRGMEVSVGWQLQGSQFRRAVVYHDESLKGSSQQSRMQREEISLCHPDLYRFPASLPQTHHGRKQFNHYAPNFVYQYVKAPWLTIGELREAAEAVHREFRELQAEADRTDRSPGAVRRAQ